MAGSGNAVGRGLGLLFTLMLAALFVPDEYGYIRWAMSVGMLAAIPAAAGPPALARALGAAEGAPERRRVLVVVGLTAVALMTGLCALVTAIVLHAEGRTAGGALVVLAGMSLFFAAFNVYRGLGDATRMAALYAGGNALQLAIVLVLCGALGLRVPDLALAVYAFAWAIVLLLVERRRLGTLVRTAGATFAAAGWPRAAAELGRLWGPLLVAQASYTVWMWADLVLVAHLLGVGAAGQYGLAKTLATVFLLVPEAVAMVLLPHVAARGRAADTLSGHLIALSTIVSLALLGLVLAVAPPALGWWAGGQYAPAALALPGVAVGMAVYAVYLVVEGNLVGAGHAAAHAIGVTVMAAVMLAGVALLAPLFGLAGAGFACAGGATAGLVTLVGLGWRARRGEG